MCKQQDDSRITERWHKSNIYDLAAETGLSIATISRYINNKGNVAQKSTVKIEKAIQKLSYSPSMTARGLATGTVNIIGLDCSMAVVKSDYGFQFISGAHEKALEEGYNILLLNPEGDEEEYCSHMLSQNMITGFLCSEASKDMPERFIRRVLLCHTRVIGKNGMIRGSMCTVDLVIIG